MSLPSCGGRRRQKRGDFCRRGLRAPTIEHGHRAVRAMRAYSSAAIRVARPTLDAKGGTEACCSAGRASCLRLHAPHAPGTRRAPRTATTSGSTRRPCGATGSSRVVRGFEQRRGPPETALGGENTHTSRGFPYAEMASRPAAADSLVTNWKPWLACPTDSLHGTWRGKHLAPRGAWKVDLK